MRYFRRMDAEYVGYAYKDYEHNTGNRRKAKQIAKVRNEEEEEKGG